MHEHNYLKMNAYKEHWENARNEQERFFGLVRLWFLESKLKALHKLVGIFTKYKKKCSIMNWSSEMASILNSVSRDGISM